MLTVLLASLWLLAAAALAVGVGSLAGWAPAAAVAGAIGAGLQAVLPVQQQPVAVALLLAAVLVAAVLLGVQVGLLRPLQAVVRRLEAMMNSGAYRRFGAEAQRTDTVGAVARFYNHMVSSLEKISSTIRRGQEMRSDIDMARRIQQGLMPHSSVTTPSMLAHARTRSVTDVGGDMYTFIRRENDALMYIGDVTGHGISAALVMAMVNTLLHTYAETHRSGKDIIDEVNRQLHKRITENMFASAVLLRWDEDTGQLYATGAGHEHIIIWRASTRRAEAIRSGGIALGMIGNTGKISRERLLPVEPGDMVILYTDGITEARGENGDMYRVERLLSAVEKYASPKVQPGDLFDAISRDFSIFVGGKWQQKDDITLIVVKILLPEGGNGQTFQLQGDLDELHSAKVWQAPASRA